MIPTLKKGLMAAACAVAMAGASLSTAQAAEPASARLTERPNVLLIVADDLGYADVGFQKQSRDVVTPNLDRLAAKGTIMTAGYVSASVCGPTRAGLMTGQYQQRFGYHDNVAPFVREEGIEQGLPVELTTMADRMKDVGYRTGMVGKWHDGDAEHFWPHNRGFEEFFGFNNGAANYFVGPINQQEQQKKPWSAMYRNDQPVSNFDDYLTDRFGDEAVSYIERHKNEPFFLYVAFNAVHGPLQARPEDLERFKHITDDKRRTVLAMNYNLDQNVGKIVSKLEKLELMDDTLIVFISDNGGKLNDNRSFNTPLRGEKGTYWDGGIRVPFTFTWEGVIPAGKTLNEPVIALDLLPTFLNAVGAEVRKEWDLDGVNLLPYVKGQVAQLDNRYFYWDNQMSWAIRDDEWKLIKENKFNKQQKTELFRISQDISESNNVADQYPEVVAKMTSAYMSWNAENDTPKWGWRKTEFPVANGYRGRH
ncbi:sulfatase-like hydrolase/transferase [Endozoicomonas elysicola]|uniref:sulfatase-like hydrolase/transferase n=1 Tax=Endozoicomonas elysicola TaxID=305900 RepID=UPI000368FFB3|nr:sulfatase-like hydrolase/transferase [Endozoicomonas elysicola]